MLLNILGQHYLKSHVSRITQHFPDGWILKVLMILFHEYHCNQQDHENVCVCAHVYVCLFG